MQDPANSIGFASVTQADKPMLRAWLSTPASREWWGEPDHEIGLIFDGEKTGESRGFIAHHTEKGPFAYIQCWPCDAQPEEALAKEPWIAKQAAGTLGVDITIGRPDLLDQGLGTATVRAFCAMLFDQGAPRLIIDPDASNMRAVRAYEKAGFVRFDHHTRPDGTTLLMEMLAPTGDEGHQS